MSKNKLIIALAMGLLLTGCTDDKYVSVRHPEGENVEISDSALDPISEEEGASEETNTETEETTEEPEESQEPEKVEVTDEMLEEPSDDVIFAVTGEVNVRMAPSENSGIIGQARPGDEIIKLGDTDNWSRVTVNGLTGYIRSDLLTTK